MTRGGGPPAGGKSQSCHLEDATRWDVATAAAHIWPVGAPLGRWKFFLFAVILRAGYIRIQAAD